MKAVKGIKKRDTNKERKKKIVESGR